MKTFWAQRHIPLKIVECLNVQYIHPLLFFFWFESHFRKIFKIQNDIWNLAPLQAIYNVNVYSFFILILCYFAAYIFFLWWCMNIFKNQPQKLHFHSTFTFNDRRRISFSCAVKTGVDSKIVKSLGHNISQHNVSLSRGLWLHLMTMWSYFHEKVAVILKPLHLPHFLKNKKRKKTPPVPWTAFNYQSAESGEFVLHKSSCYDLLTQRITREKLSDLLISCKLSFIFSLQGRSQPDILIWRC